VNEIFLAAGGGAPLTVKSTMKNDCEAKIIKKYVVLKNTKKKK
jgi:hypothetical protein